MITRIERERREAVERAEAALRERLAAGTYAPGAPLPDHDVLVAELDVDGRALAVALRRLRDAGLVDVAPGGAASVRAHRPVIHDARTRLSRAERDAERGTFVTDCRAADLVPDVDTRVEIVAADPEVAGLVDVLPGAEVVVRERVMRGGDEVLQLSTSYLPRSVTRGTWIEDRNTGPGGLYRRLEELGFELTAFTERVTIGRATEHEARLLSLTAGDPLFRLTRIARSHEKIVEAHRAAMTADRHELVYELPAT